MAFVGGAYNRVDRQLPGRIRRSQTYRLDDQGSVLQTNGVELGTYASLCAGNPDLSGLDRGLLRWPSVAFPRVEKVGRHLHLLTLWPPLDPLSRTISPDGLWLQTMGVPRIRHAKIPYGLRL